jgi:hypothetical protein
MSIPSYILKDVKSGKLTPDEMTVWVQTTGPTPTEVKQVLTIAKLTEPRVNLGWAVVGGKIVAYPGMPSSPGTPQEAPTIGNLPGVSNVSDFLSRLISGNVWLRVAEVIAGLILLWVGLNALARGTAAGAVVNSAKRTVKTGVGLAAVA